MPELWKNGHYKNKNLRNNEKLLTEYKKIISDSTIEVAKIKIANMRTRYRKKVIKSQISGAGVDDVYVSNLWYFDAFEFLRDIEMPLPGHLSISSDVEENINLTNMTIEKFLPFDSYVYARFLTKAF